MVGTDRDMMSGRFRFYCSGGGIMRKRGLEDWIRQVESVFLETKDGEAHSNQLIKTTQDIVDKSGGGENSICEITSVSMTTCGRSTSLATPSGADTLYSRLWVTCATGGTCGTLSGG